MKPNFFQRLELWFWDWAIQTLSRSTLTRSCLRNAYQFVTYKPVFLSSLLIGGSGMVGLLSGYLFRVLTLAVR